MFKKRKFSFGALFGTLLVVLFFAVTFTSVYAYFTATADSNITFNYATLTIEVENENNTFQIKTANSFYNSLYPRDVISFSDIKINNTGSTDIYVLVYLERSVVKSGQKTISYSGWYNLSGDEYDENAQEVIPASYLNKKGEDGDNLTFDLDWTLPGSDLDNNYQNATVTAKITVCAVQAYLPNVPDGSTDEQYATTFIVDNYTNFQSK